jgi:hypothetical protein
VVALYLEVAKEVKIRFSLYGTLHSRQQAAHSWQKAVSGR